MGSNFAPEILHDRVETDFRNHPPESPVIHAALDIITETMLFTAHKLIDLVPSSRELSTALTKLEEVSMHAKAGIARNQDRVSLPK